MIDDGNLVVGSWSRCEGTKYSNRSTVRHLISYQQLLSYALAFNFTHSRRTLRACEKLRLHIEHFISAGDGSDCTQVCSHWRLPAMRRTRDPWTNEVQSLVPRLLGFFYFAFFDQVWFADEGTRTLWRRGSRTVILRFY